MQNILVLFAHPALEKSRVQKKMAGRAKNHDGIYFHDLYEVYPDLDINPAAEQQLLLKHDVIIFQHPFYWYSAPAIIKQWLDLVLEHGWAYGTGGNALRGKKMMNAISCGASREVYRREGRNRYTINELLAPFNQTAFLCGMTYLPPFVIHGTHKLQETDINLLSLQYENMLVGLQSNRITPDEWSRVEYMNDLIPIPQTIQS